MSNRALPISSQGRAGDVFKPLPHKVTKRAKNRADLKADEAARQEVRKEDRYRCRVCERKTHVVHEHKRRGAGGVVSLQNSFLACDEIDGGVCHPLLQSRHITPICPVDPFDAREDLVFEMTEKVAAIVFERRTRTDQVRILPS